jgi:DNA-binding transcriptional LysR family regulator
MNLAQVEIFCRVAELGSIAEAARLLDSNRTRLSMALKSLEKDLGVELFQRSGNRLALSEAGKTILRDCENLVSTADRIKNMCRVKDGTFAAEIWIARDDSLPGDFWRDTSLALSKKYPATSFSLVQASSGDLASMIELKQVDYAFGIDYVLDDMPSLKYQRLGKIRMMSVCRSEHKLAKMRRVEDFDLRRELQVCLAYLNLKENPELAPMASRFIGFNSFEHMLDAILRESAWGVLPEPLIKSYLREEQLGVIRHSYGLVQEEFCLLTPDFSHTHPAMEWLAEQVTEYLFSY